MILTTHALIGAAIGKKISQPWLIIIISLIIHFLLDGLRHGEYFDDRTATVKNTYRKIGVDLAIGFSLIGTYLFFFHPDIITIRNIFLGTFFSMLPDALTLINYWKPEIKLFAQIKKFHGLAHRYKYFPKYGTERQWNLRNIVNDAILSLCAFVIIFFL